MPRLANISVVVIAALLVGEVVVDRLVPAVAFFVTKGRDEAAMTECEQAHAAVRLIASRHAGGKGTDTALIKSANVQLLSCLHQEGLKSRLLRWGVRESSLRSVELDIISRSTDVSYDEDYVRSQ